MYYVIQSRYGNTQPHGMLYHSLGYCHRKKQIGKIIIETASETKEAKPTLCHVYRGSPQAAERTHCAHATMLLVDIIGYNRMLVYLGQLDTAP